MKTPKFRAFDYHQGMLYTTPKMIIVPRLFNHLDFSDSEYGRITLHRNKKGYTERIIIGHVGKLMQYSSLQDKRFTDIYEDDIVSWRKSINKEIYQYMGKILFEAGSFIVASKKLDDSYSPLLDFHFEEDWCDNLVVEGNIHENPELLK